MQTMDVDIVSGTGMPLLLDDIDTDRIIPARYLRCVTFDGIGEHAFEDDRRHAADHPFDDDRFRAGSVLIAGRNFGCGSSREHAPQSLMRWGIKTIIAESFAEIFFGNCTSLGIPAVRATRVDLENLDAAVKSNPQLEITVDLTDTTVRFADEVICVEIPEGSREALTTGQWDFLTRLLAAEDQIDTAAVKVPYLAGF